VTLWRVRLCVLARALHGSGHPTPLNHRPLCDRWSGSHDGGLPARPKAVVPRSFFCIINNALQHGRVVLKKIKRGVNGGYDLLSNKEKPIRDAQIKWAARVKNMEPR
jgi:hypothetical protein